MATPKTSTKRVRNRRGIGRGIEPEGAEAPRPDIGRIIENGLTMLMPFILERIVASATAPARHPASVGEPLTRGEVDAHRIGVADGRESVLHFVPVPQDGCECTACRSLRLYADKFGRAGVQ